jgi:phosphodiesterase/alkaline phosphatase D-like protein
MFIRKQHSNEEREVKLRILTLAGILLLVGAPIAAALSTVHVDFQVSRTTGVTAPGYVAIDNTSRWDTGAQVTLDSGVQGGWTAYFHGGTRDRATSDPLLRDLVMWTGTTTPDTFRMTGLQPGDYSLTVYSYDPSYPGSVYKTSVSIDGNNDSVNETSFVTLQQLAPVTTPVTVSTAGILNVTFGPSAGSSAVVNGFDLTAGVPDTIPPAAIADLSVTATSAATVSLRWTAPTDNSGKAASYNIRYSTSAITDDATFAAATAASGAPAPATAGQQENVTVSGLSPATQYYFAIKAADSSGNVSALSNGATGTTQAPDTTAPAVVTNLAATAVGRNQLTLTWTATGDDGSSGTATTYNIRYSTAPISNATFAAATALTGLPAPRVAGSAESVTVTGLQAGTTYYFAMKVADEVPNWSDLSNLPEATTLPPDVTPPAAVTDLSVTNTTGSAALLQWTAPADDSGKAASYDVRYSTSPITAANWSSAAQAAGEPAPSNPGQTETFTVNGLAPTTKYYFAVKSVDASGNSSALSNVPSCTTLAAALRSEVHVDFQIAGWVTAPGYVAVTNLNRLDNGTWVDLGGGVRGGWTAAFVGDNRDRATADALTRDFLMVNSGGAAQTFQMRGIQPGTYSLKIYATDTTWHTGNTLFAIDQNNDGAADTSLTISNSASEATKTVQVTVSMAGIVSIVMSGVGTSIGLCNGLDLAAATDTIPPAAVIDLAVTNTNSTQAMLRWTAPADDNGAAGRVGSYDVRYGTSPIDAAGWATALQATGEPTPSSPGQSETFTVSGLTPGTTYYFAVRAVDFDNNVAPLSNVPSGITAPADLIAPAAVADLAATAVDANWLTLTWTASGDDDHSGTATTHDVRYSTSPITDDASFAAAMPLTGVPAPKSAGTAQTFLVTDLTGSTTYWFAMKVADEMPNWSGLSNVLQVTTLPPDVIPPAAIVDLAASNVQSNTVTLTWTAPGDSGNVGTAVAYDIRYSTTPIANDAEFAAAESFASVPVPHAAGSTEFFLAGGLQADTTYYFAIKASDNGVPANVSALSNVVAVGTLPAASLAYAVSNEFSLDAAPSGPYAPALAASGTISITNISVDQAAITRSLSSSRSGPVYTGVIHYDLAAPMSSVHVWLELSTDGGVTWSQRPIHAVGSVGTLAPGTGKMAPWLVDGDRGNHCRIRIRVNGGPATYSNIDADNNKYPRPAPWDEYPTIERLTDSKDFVLSDARYVLPHVDFYKSLSAGQMKVGFARVPFFNTGGNNSIPNPQFFLHACYLESLDGQQKYLILAADSLYVMTNQICGWRDQINAACGIPKDHIMVMYTHVHNGGYYVPGVETFPLPLIPLAVANAQPVEIGWLNKDMGTSYSTHRNLLLDPTHAASSFSNYLYDPYPSEPTTDVLWQYDPQGNIIGAMLDGRPWNSPYQMYFDGPLDSYLQTIVFRNTRTHTLTGMLCKFTTHPVNRDYYGDLPRCVMDTIQARVGSNVEVMWTCGFAGNNRPVASQAYPVAIGSQRMANGFAQAIVDALPTMEFTALKKLGTVVGYDLFGDTSTDPHRRGSDPDRVGTAVRVWRLNDIYFSTLPSEACQEQGLYIRGRTSDLKHMYDAYGDGYFNYFQWGRGFGVQCYENSGCNRYDSFRMAQEITRGVAILEQSVDALHLPGDLNNDGQVDMFDLVILAGSWGLSQADADYNPSCDLNGDGTVNVIDLLTLAQSWGT